MLLRSGQHVRKWLVQTFLQYYATTSLHTHSPPTEGADDSSKFSTILGNSYKKQPTAGMSRSPLMTPRGRLRNRIDCLLKGVDSPDHLWWLMGLIFEFLLILDSSRRIPAEILFSPNPWTPANSPLCQSYSSPVHSHLMWNSLRESQRSRRNRRIPDFPKP